MRRNRSIVLMLVCAAAILALPVRSHAARADDEHENEGDGRVLKGYAIAPVPLNLEGRDRALVGLGSYLVNAVGSCNDCHTHPNFAKGGDPYRGQPMQINTLNYLAGGRQFGPFVSRNLTPEAPSGRPAGLTLAQFTDVLHNGTDYDLVHPKISPLLQVMPWPIYHNMTDHDIRAIYEFLSAVPHAETGPIGP